MKESELALHKRYPIITLCGSTRFRDVHDEVAKELALMGYCVLTIDCFGHVDPDPRIQERKPMLDRIHLQKIDMADLIYVLDKDGYIGESTAKEIEHARKQGKVIIYHTKDGLHRVEKP